jgi:hypothetical protein
MAIIVQRPDTRPAYSPWHTVDRAFAWFKASGVPTQIDKEVMAKAFPTDVASRLVTSFRTLKLIDDKGFPQKELTALVKSRETPLWETNLRALLQKNYAFLNGIEFETISPDDLYKAFSKHAKLDDGTLQKGVSFFVGAAYAAGIILSPPLRTRAKMAASVSEVKERRKTNVPKPSQTQTVPAKKDHPVKPETTNPALSKQERVEKIMDILRMFSGEGLPAEQLAALLCLLDYAKKTAATE